MLRTFSALIGALLVASLFHLPISSCGKSDNTTVAPSTATATPTPTPTAGEYDLAPYAKITASSTQGDAWGADLTADYVFNATSGDSFVIPLATNTDGFMWRPATGTVNSSWIEFGWNSQVVITEIHLYDDPILNSQITSGQVHFENTIDTTLSAFTDQEFTALPDAGTTFTTVAGPSNPVTSVRVKIINTKDTVNDGLDPGLSQVVIRGYRVDEAIASGEISPYLRIMRASSTSGALDAGYDDGPYRTAKAKDGNTTTYWKSNGNGTNAYLDVAFDRTYSVTAIKLTDLPPSEGTHFLKGTVKVFDAADVETDLAFEKTANASDVSVPVSSALSVARLRVTFSNITGGLDVGLAEISVTGSYTP